MSKEKCQIWVTTDCRDRATRIAKAEGKTLIKFLDEVIHQKLLDTILFIERYEDSVEEQQNEQNKRT